MIVYLLYKTSFRADLLKERGRLAYSHKITSTGRLVALPLFDTVVKPHQSV